MIGKGVERQGGMTQEGWQCNLGRYDKKDCSMAHTATVWGGGKKYGGGGGKCGLAGWNLLIFFLFFDILILYEINSSKIPSENGEIPTSEIGIFMPKIGGIKTENPFMKG